MYEAQWEALQKRDYEIEQLLAKAKVKALKQNDLRVYDDLELKKLTRKQMRAYLNADKAKERPEIDMDEINKDWQGKDLDNKAYGDFWKPIDRADLPRGSQSVKRSRQGSRQSARSNQLPTPERKRRQIRELYLPEITKNTWVKKKEVDLTTLYEDPYFMNIVKPDRFKRRGFRTGKASMDARIVLGQIPGG